MLIMPRRVQRERRRRLDGRVEHIRYNWEIKEVEEGDTRYDSSSVVRYHFVVNSKNPRAIIDDLLRLAKTGDSAISPRTRVYPTKTKSGLTYMLVSCDSNTDPRILEEYPPRIPFKRDRNLRDGQRQEDIVDYLKSIYEK